MLKVYRDATAARDRTCSSTFAQSVPQETLSNAAFKNSRGQWSKLRLAVVARVVVEGGNWPFGWK